MITGAQIREARELLGWTEQTLANKAKVHLPTVTRAESREGLSRRHRGQLIKITRALEAAGVEFTNGGQPGVRLRAVPS